MLQNAASDQVLHCLPLIQQFYGIATGRESVWHTQFTLSIGTEMLVNSIDPDKMLHNAASDQVLHCLPLIQQFYGIVTGNKMDFGRESVWCTQFTLSIGTEIS